MKMVPITRGDVSSSTSLEMPSGAFVELTDPHPADILLEDIAHNLAEETRYGGSCSERYTVAEHAVLVARRLRAEGQPPATVLEGLHHDDPEAFLKDIPRPLKRIIGPLGYKDLESRFAERIAVALKFEGFHPTAQSMAQVKKIDDWALGLEAKALLPSQGRGWAPPWSGSRSSARLLLHRVAVGGGAAAAEQYLAEHRLCIRNHLRQVTP